MVSNRTIQVRHIAGLLRIVGTDMCAKVLHCFKDDDEIECRP